MHPFRFGLLVEQFSSPHELLELARLAEDQGFATLLVRDHLIGAPFAPQYAPWTTLATVAARTSTLRVGTMVAANDFRHPAVLAKEVTTLDQLSGGRVELGIGAGFLREEYERTGLRFDSNKVRVERMRESLLVLDHLLSGQELTHTGPHYTFDHYVNFPPPVQRPRPPILVAGGGRKVLTIAAHCADSIGLLSAPLTNGALIDSAEARSPANLLAQLEIVREAAPVRFADLELSVIATLVQADNRYHAAEAMAQQRGWTATPEAVLQMPSTLIGTTSEIVESLEERRERFGISYIVVRDRQLPEAARVVRQLAGLMPHGCC